MDALTCLIELLKIRYINAVQDLQAFRVVFNFFPDVRQVYSVELLAVAGSVCVVARGRQAGLQC